MSLWVYNTLNGKKEIFEPLEEGKVKMYVCGPTVYDSCHIGHARAVVVFDVVVKYLKASGYEVTYVRNFTDVDDKIINRANELGVYYSAVSKKYIKEFYEDMDALNNDRATIEPKATEHINDIIHLVKKFVDENKAYEVDGDVYFDINSYEEYGKLSGRKIEDMEAGARIEVDKRKKNPHDFALWKKVKPEEPSWESPWGQGRPGWHIECSAMSHKYLGESFDIHGGGKDLIFPHHENEITQSEAAFGKQFVKYWMHNGFVNINHEKMSKSLGNFLRIKDVIKEYHPEVIRLFLLSNHYRSPIDFSQQSMEETTIGLDRLYTLLKRVDENGIKLSDIDTNQKGDIYKKFCESMDDDFNTAHGIGILYDALKNTNRLFDENKANISSNVKKSISDITGDILKIGKIIGILTNEPYAYFDTKKSSVLKEKEIDSEKIEELIEARTNARKEKDFTKADQIRDELDHMNIIVEDKPEGTVWKIK